jgi:peptidoglycan hydrolase-like protein with peptidoglycan-binding domain
VPTNGIHATERRIKRKLYQNRGVMGLIAATLLGIVVLGEQTAPPDTTDFEQEIAASQAADTGSRQASSPPGIIKPNSLHDSLAMPGPEAGQVSERHNKNLSEGELVEMERLLARLDLGPSTADGVVNDQTEAAIRLYQEIAGLPIDGAPSRALLADMREVVKILEDGG